MTPIDAARRRRALEFAPQDCRTRRRARFRNATRLSHKPIRNPVHQLGGGITRADDTHPSAQLGERVQYGGVTDVVLPPSLEQWVFDWFAQQPPTHSAVSPRAADGCIARMMRKQNLRQADVETPRCCFRRASCCWFATNVITLSGAGVTIALAQRVA